MSSIMPGGGWKVLQRRQHSDGSTRLDDLSEVAFWTIEEEEYVLVGWVSMAAGTGASTTPRSSRPTSWPTSPDTRRRTLCPDTWNDRLANFEDRQLEIVLDNGQSITGTLNRETDLYELVAIDLDERHTVFVRPDSIVAFTVEWKDDEI